MIYIQPGDTHLRKHVILDLSGFVAADITSSLKDCTRKDHPSSVANSPMAQKCLRDIRPGNNLWSIKARVTRLWDAILLSSGELLSLDMILIDQEGTMMHGVINKACMGKFKPLIEEGNVYSISNVKVTPEGKSHRPVGNDKIVNFMPTTTVKKLKDSDDIPRYSFQFYNIDMLSKRINDDIYLSDIIGVASYIGPIEETKTQFGLSKIRDIVLLIDEQEVKLRLWNDKVDQVDANATSHIIIVTSTTVKKFGRYSLSSTNATQVYIDLPIPEVMDVQNSICSIETVGKGIQKENHLKGTLEEQMQFNRKTLEELNTVLYDSSNQERIFTVEATITAINEKYGWYYISCSEDSCKKQLDKNSDHYFCKKCDKKANPKTRYKIKLEISDSTANATCILFDKEAQMLITDSAEYMIASINEGNMELPKSIQKLCGRKLIFQFRLTDYNLTSFRPDYTVSKLFIPDTKGLTTFTERDMEATLKKDPKDYVIKKEPQDETENYREKSSRKKSVTRKRVIKIQDDEASKSNYKSTKLQGKRKNVNRTSKFEKEDITKYSKKETSNSEMEDSDVSSDDGGSSSSKLQSGKKTRRYMTIEEDSDSDKNHARKEAAVEEKIRAGERIAKKIAKLENQFDKPRPKRAIKSNPKYKDIA